MKRKLFIVSLLSIVMLMSIMMTGCNKELQLDKEYTYDDINFVKAKDIKLEDMSTFIPMGYKINSIKEFEKMLLDNIDEYSINIQSSSGVKRVYLKTDIKSIKITDKSIILTKDNEIKTLEYEKQGDKYVSGEYEFYFSKGRICYDLVFNDKFKAVYRYK